MGILTINEGTEFVDLLKDHVDIEITGGRYFLGKFQERDKIIELIKHIPVDDSLSLRVCDGYLEQILEHVLGGGPVQSSYYMVTAQGTRRTCWIFDYEMPKPLNHLPNKLLHIKLTFK